MGVFIKDDLRRIKTQRFLLNALTMLLRKRNFKNITVNDLCGEAYISRSAFYANYKDKYDLLGNLLKSITIGIPIGIDSILEAVVYSNFRMIKNVLDDADYETMEIINDFALDYLGLLLRKSDCGLKDAEYRVFSNFCTGGIIHHVSRQVKNKCPEDDDMTKQHFVELITYTLEWYKGIK